MQKTRNMQIYMDRKITDKYLRLNNSDLFVIIF